MISTLLAVALSCSVSCATHIPTTFKRSAGILSLPITVIENATSSVDELRKRQKSAQIDNISTGTLYLIDLSIGTPSQPQRLIIDTGSSFDWVNPQCDTAGDATNVALCNSLPRYDQFASSSSVDSELEGSFSYTKGKANLHFYTDNFLVGGATVDNVMFGVGLSSENIPAGILGVAPGSELTGYPNIIDTLATTKVTQSRAFSLDLRSVDSPTGALIFGGIDTNKYIGKLEKLPIIAAQTADQAGLYWINLNSVSITKPGQCEKVYSSASKAQPVYLDSAGTLSRLPSALVSAIVADFPGATLDSTTGLYAVDCSVATQAGTVNFGFGGTTIRVSYKDFIWQTGGVCYLGAVASSDTFVLGDTFLRAAFVVFDQDNKNVLLAQAANCGTNLVAIGTGVDAVPSVTGGCAVATATASACSSSTSSQTSTTSSVTSSVTTSVLSTANSSIALTGSSTLTSASSTGSSTTLTSPTSSVPSSSAPYPSMNGTVTLPSTTLTSSSTLETATSTGPATTPSGGVSSSGNTNLPTTELTTSTVYATSVYTVTSCAPTVTNCPAVIGKVTTEVTIAYVTICPVTSSNQPPVVTPTPAPPGDSTVYTTRVITITSCPPSVQNCPYGSVTTIVVPVYPTIVANTQTVTKGPSTTDIIYKTTTYTVTKCPASVTNCPYGSVTTTTVPVLTATSYPPPLTKTIIPGSPSIVSFTPVVSPSGPQFTAKGSNSTILQSTTQVIQSTVVGGSTNTPAKPTTSPITVVTNIGSNTLSASSSILLSAIVFGLLAVV